MSENGWTMTKVLKDGQVLLDLNEDDVYMTSDEGFGQEGSEMAELTRQLGNW
jgi:hypothetical protein